MASFKVACDLMIAHEGGYCNHPLDNGGPTKYGITIKTLTIHRFRPCTPLDVQNLAEDEARAIYKKSYWDPLFGEQIRSQPMANMLFDQAVNRGVKGALKTLQVILHQKVDCIMGPETMNALNAANCAVKYFKACQMEYVGIVLGNPSQKEFLRGWLRRTHAYLSDSV